MQSTKHFLILFLIVSTGAGNLVSQSPLSAIPGHSVGDVTLGSDLKRFSSMFPKHPNIDQYDPRDWCGNEIYHWVDLDLGAAGVFAYLANQRIVQLSIQTGRYSLANGLSVGSTEERVKLYYPNARKYRLLGSGSDINGGRDLLYMVDESSGVAFELYWDHRRKGRFVSAIDIFYPNADYRPEACVAPPRQWKAVPR
jgi:hypothetical protein